MSESQGTAQIREERDHGRAAAQAGPQSAIQLQLALRTGLAAVKKAYEQAHGLEDAFEANGYMPEPAFTAKLREAAAELADYAQSVARLI
jgi:hypothetical protein